MPYWSKGGLGKQCKPRSDCYLGSIRVYTMRRLDIYCCTLWLFQFEDKNSLFVFYLFCFVCLFFLLQIFSVSYCFARVALFDWNREQTFHWNLKYLNGFKCRFFVYKYVFLFCLFCLICGFTSQSTKMAMSRRSVDLATLFMVRLPYQVHITSFRQQLTTALLESAVGRKWP